MYIGVDWCLQSGRVTVMLSCTTAQHISCTNKVKLYSLQLNCTYSNYTEAAATCSAAQHINCTNTVQTAVCNWTVLTVITQKLLPHVQLHSSRTHLLYKLYSLQLNCTYSNYTEAAATCSAAQKHSTFTVQVLYKLHTLELNCTYNNYTEAAATFSAAQQHNTFTVQTVQSANVLYVQ